MATKTEPKEEKKEIKGFYKGYDMRWLKKEVDHPDHYLVAEYEAEFGEIK
jgi:hypothetical protein